MKRAISAMLAAIMLSAMIVMPAAAADSSTVTAYFEDFESGSRGNIQAVNIKGTPAAELSVVDYKTYNGTTSKVLKVKSNGYSGNPAFMYDPADASVGEDGLRISFDFYMDSDTYKNKVDNTGSAVPLIWSENKAVNSGNSYWFTVAGTWKADNDNKTFAGTGIKSCTGTWWRLIQDYDFKNRRYSVSITDLFTGDIYGSYCRYLSSIKAADDKFDRAAIILPIKDSVTYIDNFSCLPLNRLCVDFGAETNEIEIGEGSATVRAFDGWITAVAVDNAARELAYAKNESAVVDLSALSEGEHKLTTTVSYNDGTSKTTDTPFFVINNRAVYVDENFDGYSEAKATTDNGGAFADDKQALIAKGVLNGDNLDFAQVRHKADGLTENIRGASGGKNDYALKIGVTSTDEDAEDFYDGFQINPAEYVTNGQFVIEMDTMVSANTRVRLEGMAQDNGEVFTRSGKTMGNRAAEYVPDKWKRLRIECDYENTADFCRDGINVTASGVYTGKVYYDDRYIGMMRLDASNRWLRMTVNGDVGGYLAVDNLRIYKWTDIPHLYESFDSYDGDTLPSGLELDARDCTLNAAPANADGRSALSLTASGDSFDPDWAPTLIATLPSAIGQNALISMDVNIRAADTDDRLFGFYIMDKGGYSCFDASNFAISGSGIAGIYQDEKAQLEIGKWYRLNVAIDLLAGVYSVRLTDSSTGSTAYAAVDAALSDGAASEISTLEINMLGSGEVLLDNISVLGDAPVSDSFEIISPKEGSARSVGSLAVNAPSEFAALEFIMDGKIIRTFRDYSKSHVYRAGAELAYGRHTFEALLTDKNGGCKSESVDFEVTLNDVNPLKGFVCISNGIENGYVSEVPYNAQGLKLYLNTGLKGSSVNTDTVSVYSGGKRISLSGVSYDEGEKSVTALLGEMLLPTGGEMRIDGAELADGALLARSIKGEFAAISDDVFISGAQILKDGNTIDSKYQLADNAGISVRTNILNPTYQTRSAVLAAAVYSAGRLTAVRTKSVTVEPMHKSDVIIENMKHSENFVVKTMLLDGFDSMRPLGMQMTAEASAAAGLSEEPLLEYDFETERDYDKLPKGNTITEEKDENGNTYVLYERTKADSDGSYNDCFTDITMPAACAYAAIDADSYVVECDIRVDALNTDASLRGIDVITYKSSTGAWGSPPLRIDGNGGIRLGDSVVGQMNTDGVWTRLSLLYNNKTAKLSCFKNGICIADGFDFDPSFLPALYRIGVQINGKNVIFGMDNFRIYKADKPTNYVVKKGNRFESVMESALQAVQTVGVNDFVLMVNNGAYLAGRVKKTSRALPYIENDTVMLPITLCGECFGSDASQSGKNVMLGENVKMTVGGTDLTVGKNKYTLSQPPAERNNTVYIPLEEVAEKAFGKHYYWDDRGFAVVSDSEFTLRNSDAVEILDEPIDTLYRYLQFERPSGSRLIAAIEENSPNNKHPRVLATADDIAAMRENISRDETMASWAKNVIADADSYAKTAGQIEPPEAGASMLSQSRDVLDRVRSYAGAYFITGDEGYAEYAWIELCNVCTSFENWGDKSGFLDAAEMAYAFAIGYDSFYDLFTAAQKKQLRDAVVKNAFEPGLVAYRGKHPNGYWINGDDNWTAVCPGGLMSAAIAMADEDDTREICENILGCTVQSLEYVMSLLYPDGGWYESMGYFDYTMEYLYAGIGSLINATGSDWGLLNVPGAKNSCAYTLYLHGLINGSFNYHDGGGSKWGNMITGPEMLWFAKQTGQLWYGERYVKLQSILERKLSKLQVPKLDITALLNYSPDWQSGEELPLDNYFRQTEAGSMRQNWSEDATFVGVHAGRNGVDHDHLDLGEFVFEADGVRWVNDFGADDYSLPNYFKEYNIYLKRPEANNCYVINPREEFPGQRTKCSTKLLKRESADDRAFMTFDLTQAYADDASSAIRGFLLDDDRRTLLIRDEIELKQSSEIDWFMNMNAWGDGNRPAYTIDGNTITFRNGTKTLRAELVTNADSYEFIVMNREPLFPSTIMGKVANETKSFPKLRIKLNGEGKLYIAVKLIPGSADDAAGISDTPISQW